MTRLLVLLPLILLLGSCALVTAPVRLAGNVVQGTARVTRAAATAPFDAFDERKQRKEDERRRKETREPEAGGAGANPGDGSAGFGSSPSFGDLAAPDGGPPLDGPYPAVPDPGISPDADPLLPDFGD